MNNADKLFYLGKAVSLFIDLKARIISDEHVNIIASMLEDGMEEEAIELIKAGEGLLCLMEHLS